MHRQLYYIFVNVQARVYGRAILSNCYINMYGAYAYAYGYIRRTMFGFGPVREGAGLKRREGKWSL